MTSEMTLTSNIIAQIDSELEKYPADQKLSAVMSALRIVEDEYRWLSWEIMQEIADYLEMPAIHVYEVATFYSMYEHQDVGRHKISVCTNISCQLCGSNDVLKYLREKTGIGPGETTDDGKITIKEVECLGACAGAPMMQVNKDYHENLTTESIDRILKELD